MSAVNDLGFVEHVVHRLRESGVETWIFGGWAEELRGLSPTREHRDLDLLYPAADFDRVDSLFLEGKLIEIVGKRFPHKRAFVLEGVMVELFLVERDELGMHTSFWATARHDWPEDTLSERRGLPVASESALVGFRANHEHVHQARVSWFADALDS